MTRKKPLSRRAFLRTAAGSAIALPLLNAMGGVRRTGAQLLPLPRRVIFFFSPCGPNPNLWWPTGGEHDFTLGQSHQPLLPFRDQLIILDDIEMKSASADSAPNGHDKGSGHCLAPYFLEQGSGPKEFGHLTEGSVGGKSIDQHIADSLAAETPYRSLEFGVDSGDPTRWAPFHEWISWRGPYVGRPAMQQPGAAFDRIFAPLAPNNRDRARQRRRLQVLDGVDGGLARLRTRFGREDQMRVDAHLQSIHELAGRIERTSRGPVCDLPPREDSSVYGDIGRMHIDLMVRALSCDLTRVASLQWSTAQSKQTFSELGHVDRHHALSHRDRNDAEGRRQIGEIDYWYAQQFAYLLDSLAQEPAGEGQTLLDQTVVVWVNEQAVGTGNMHKYDRMPYMLAGPCGGAFRTGRYLRFPGRSHSDLFVSIMNAMGVEGDSFGDSDFCTGALPGLT